MFKAAVLTVSDRSFRGERPDAGGPLVVEILKNAGYTVTETAIVPDEKGRIEAALRQWCDREPVDLIVTTGGTGFAPRENLEAVLPALAHGLEMLSGRPADCAGLTD